MLEARRSLAMYYVVLDSEPRLAARRQRRSVDEPRATVQRMRCDRQFAVDGTFGGSSDAARRHTRHESQSLPLQVVAVAVPNHATGALHTALICGRSVARRFTKNGPVTGHATARASR